MNNQMTYPFLILNKFIDFLESIKIFSILFYVFEHFFTSLLRLYLPFTSPFELPSSFYDLYNWKKTFSKGN